MDVSALEQQHASLGLRFADNRFGSFPVQAYGWLGEDRFYFRFRGDYARLIVGPVDPLLDEARALRVTQQNVQFREIDEIRYARVDPEDEKERRFQKAMMCHRVGNRPQKASDVGYHPEIVTRSADISSVTGEGYAGTLDQEQFADVFTRLLRQLRPVPKSEQIHPSTIRWLTEGGLWPIDRTVKPPATLIRDCSCGGDHVTMPRDVVLVDKDGRDVYADMVCAEHKKHEPCRPCMRRDDSGPAHRRTERARR
ncbi:hypothetical protein ACFVAJ_19050 [Agromyces sp. NPDC057679]|uniref:hypothetical protein n=1 Tax=Agromyces sp. NPDC057679 TaxID=3346207 RepID=UPI00366FB0B3